MRTAKAGRTYRTAERLFTEREELSARMSALDKEVYRLNAQREKLEESMENQVNYMWNEYELTLRDAAQLRDETMNDLAEMKSRRRRSRKRSADWAMSMLTPSKIIKI